MGVTIIGNVSFFSKKKTAQLLKTHYINRYLKRYPYFPACDDTIALSHIGELIGLAGLREAATALGRKLTINGLKETSATVQQIVRKQRNSSKHPTETGMLRFTNF